MCPHLLLVLLLFFFFFFLWFNGPVKTRLVFVERARVPCGRVCSAGCVQGCGAANNLTKIEERKQEKKEEASKEHAFAATRTRRKKKKKKKESKGEAFELWCWFHGVC